MKKNIVNLLILAVATMLVTSCNEKYPIMFDESQVIVGFDRTALTILESSAAGGSLNVYLGGVTGTPATDVVLQVSTEGKANPAIEGTDYTISTKNVTASVGSTAVTITPINNDVYEGNKQFDLIIISNSKNYDLAVQHIVTVTLRDDEHPLNRWIGTYDVVAVSYSAPGAYDEVWTVTTVGGDTPTTLKATGIADGTEPAIVALDTVNMTLEIESGQSLGDIYPAYGPYAGSVYYGTDELIDKAGDYFDASLLSAARGIKMTGTFTKGGVIRIDRMAIILDDYVYCWDVFNTTWTKR